MTGRKGWFEKFLLPERAERRSPEQFVAYRWTGKTLKQERVRNISSTGVFIITEERLIPGTFVSVTLQREGPLEKSPERRITAYAKVVRCAEDGMGLSFLAPTDADSRKWERLVDSVIERMKPDNMLSLVSMAGGLAFLSRICPTGAEELGQLVTGRLSNHKVANALDIALKAEHLAASAGFADGIRANPSQVVRILEDGCCTDEDWLRQYWAGLLVTSSSVNGKDDSNLNFVELFSKLTTIPIRILTVVCTRATKVLSDSGSISAKPLACKIEEIMAITGSRETQIERDIERLVDLGLLDKRSLNSPTLLPNDKALVTVSNLGLELFARCNGHKAPQDFYHVDSLAVSVPAKEQ